MILCRVCGIAELVNGHSPGCPAGDADMRRVADQVLVDLELGLDEEA